MLQRGAHREVTRDDASARQAGHERVRVLEIGILPREPFSQNARVDAPGSVTSRRSSPRGARLVLDCVGVQPTVDLGARLLGRNSVWTVVGLGGGRHDFHHGSTPYGTSLSIPYWGSRAELMDVIAMARDGRIHAETAESPLEEAVDVYEKLKTGQIAGRAVLIPA